MKYLFIIPARGGSKGLPGKNIKPLNGKPLILYSLEYARLFTGDSNICISTDDSEIATVVEAASYKLPFMRPEAIATDQAGMREVILQALDHYENRGLAYDAVVLLQPTSPFRRYLFFEEASKQFNKEIDMVVGVTESKANPYFNLFEENKKGYLELSKKSDALTRQTAHAVYQYNGSIYIINTKSLRIYDSLSTFPHIVKYVMPLAYSLDIDNELDWAQGVYLLQNNLVTIDGKC
jgi:N-acylneuraminate cytidylyltransferase